MKKFVIIIVFLLTMLPILSIEVIDNTEMKTYNVNLSYGDASGGSIGIGKIQHFKRSTKEITTNIHYLKCEDYFVTGIYGQINSYRNKQRKGFFTLLTWGLDYTKGEGKPFIFPGVIGGPNEDDEEPVKFEGIFPNIVIGCGYSIRMSKNYRMLIYLDLGIKKTITNLNISISF